tara:strand:+ start:228 stop:1148 length:921 start_codon:yes stop_codon:yes gene_type:complete
MKTKVVIIILGILFILNKSQAIENKILFKVNNKIITSIDIQNEMNYLNSVNSSFKNLENDKMIEISKNSLIRNKIKEATIERMVKKIELDKSDFERILISSYSNLGIKNINELKEYLSQFNINIQSLEKRIAIESYWNQVIYDMYFKSIKIDVDQIKKNILENNMQKEYLLSEIVFNLDINENFDEKLNSIIQSIEEKGFENSALIFSISESVNAGGRLGWINENSINREILDEILKTKIKNFTKPIRVPSGFLILKINETRETEKNINLNEEIEKIVRLKTNEQLNQYSNLFFNKIKKDFKIDEL